MAQLAIIRQTSGQVSRGSAGEYQADERAGVFSSQQWQRFEDGEQVTLGRALAGLEVAWWPVPAA